MEERDKHVMLSRFMKMTQLDAGFAHDLLEGQKWNFDAAVRDFKTLQGQRRLSAQKPTPAPKSSQKQSLPQRSPPQKSSPQRSPPQRSSPPNGQMAQPIPSRSSPRMNGREGQSTTQNGGGTSPNILRHPQMRDPPKSPGTKRLVRGLSAVNTKLVNYGRQRVIDDEERHNDQLVDTPRFTFILPDLLLFPVDFRAFVEKDLIDSCTMHNLEHSGIFYIYHHHVKITLCFLAAYVQKIFVDQGEQRAFQKEKFHDAMAAISCTRERSLTASLDGNLQESLTV